MHSSIPSFPIDGVCKEVRRDPPRVACMTIFMEHIPFPSFSFAASGPCRHPELDVVATRGGGVIELAYNYTSEKFPSVLLARGGESGAGGIAGGSVPRGTYKHLVAISPSTEPSRP